MAIRRCGVCKRALREDDSWHLLRIKEGDRPGTELGLYHACGECEDDLRKSITKNRPKMVETTDRNPDGSIKTNADGTMKKKRRKKKASELTDRDML